MKKTILLLILVLLILPQISQAQLDPGQKLNLDYCFEIANINQYPDQVFIYFQGYMTAQIIRGKVCFSYFRLNNFDIFASKIYTVNQAKFNLKEFNDTYNIILPTEMTEEAAQQRVTSVMAKQNYKNSVDANPDFLQADYKFNYLDFVGKNDLLKEVKDVLIITQLDQLDFKIQNSQVIYTYENGQTEEKQYQDQAQRPQHSQKPILPWWLSAYWYIWALVLIVIVIIISLIKRKTNKF